MPIHLFLYRFQIFFCYTNNEEINEYTLKRASFMPKLCGCLFPHHDIRNYSCENLNTSDNPCMLFFEKQSTFELCFNDLTDID